MIHAPRQFVLKKKGGRGERNGKSQFVHLTRDSSHSRCARLQVFETNWLSGLHVLIKGTLCGNFQSAREDLRRRLPPTRASQPPLRAATFCRGCQGGGFTDGDILLKDLTLQGGRWRGVCAGFEGKPCPLRPRPAGSSRLFQTLPVLPGHSRPRRPSRAARSAGLGQNLRTDREISVHQ